MCASGVVGGAFRATLFEAYINMEQGLEWSLPEKGYAGHRKVRRDLGLECGTMQAY